MIRPPRRSVTRFFIPLIDVLTLLFCIFLLMPFVKSAPEGEGADVGPGAAAGDHKGDPADLAKKLEAAERELERLRLEKTTALQRLEIRTLEIDGANGELVWFTGTEPIRLKTQADAVQLINLHRDEVRHLGGQRELYYLFLYPRDTGSGFPTEAQIRSYRRWFAAVPFGVDTRQPPR